MYSEDSFHRLGQMIVEYENPIKKLSEEFIPHAKVMRKSLHPVIRGYYIGNFIGVLYQGRTTILARSYGVI